MPAGPLYPFGKRTSKGLYTVSQTLVLDVLGMRLLRMPTRYIYGNIDQVVVKRGKHAQEDFMGSGAERAWPCRRCSRADRSTGSCSAAGLCRSGRADR